MTKMMLMAAALAIAATAASAAEPQVTPAEPDFTEPTPAMKYPKMYAYKLAQAQRVGRPYFECDYSQMICVRGFRHSGEVFVGEVLDGRNRTTVLKHVACWQNFRDCNDLDAGIAHYNKPTDDAFTLQQCASGYYPDASRPCLMTAPDWAQ